jgi:hypothetical protein
LKNGSWGLPVLLPLIVFAWAWAGTARAIPRYSAQYRQDCTLCHVNPTGGGLRTLYASQYLLPAEMALDTWEPDKLEKIRPNLSSSVTVGTDLRTIHYWSESSRAEGRNFFQMQGDVYLAFQASPRFLAYLDRGQFRSLEMFGAAWVLPWHGYVKAGRFTPDFGWKFEDHTHFTREVITGQPPLQTDVGIEIGTFPGRAALSVAALNGAPDSPLYDDNDILAWSARGLYRLDVLGVGFGFGGSWWTNSTRQELRRAGGPFGYVDWRRLTWLWEADWAWTDPRDDTSTTALVTSHEVTYRLWRGVWLLGTYDWADPDLDRKSGSRLKYGGGVDVLASPFVGVRATVQAHRDEGLAGGRDDTQSQVQLHVYY